MDLKNLVSSSSIGNTSTSLGNTEPAGKHRDEFYRDHHDHDYDASAGPQPSQGSTSCQNLSNRDGPKPEIVVRKLLKGKEREWRNAAEKSEPLYLLDLPLDLLKEIVKEVTHTNDLTALALTCSAMHSLATPLIYSRFDIVWPDIHSTSESRQGVDALTYGLATLVMGEEGPKPVDTGSGPASYTCTHCGMVSIPTTRPSSEITKRRRRGNYYPQYTKKFSLGNGPPDWIRDYYSWSEGGKMLGTLVALAVARMPNLETFIWDMPTGILRDVWLALASLGDGRFGQKPRLEKIWTRLHDNREFIAAMGVPAPPHALPGTPSSLPYSQTSSSSSSPSSSSTQLEWSYRNIEYPSFSILPPLRSLNVLNIDEIAYLEELSILIERSCESLRELRLGLSASVLDGGFASTRQGTFAAENPSTSPMITGGVIGVLMSKICDCAEIRRHSSPSVPENLELPAHHLDVTEDTPVDARHSEDTDASYVATRTASEVFPVPDYSMERMDDTANTSLSSPPPFIGPETLSAGEFANLTIAGSKSNTNLATDENQKLNHLAPTITSPITGHQNDSRKRRRLKLNILELERICMSVAILQKTIDWTILTTLTLLHCESHELLWKALRRRFAPRLPSSNHISSSPASLRFSSSSKPFGYSLSLKRIHTNTVSSALLTFLKETLAPNSLEWLLLQDCALVQGAPEPYDSAVSVESIYRGPLRRHRTSLKKVMIDSGDGTLENRQRNQKWRKWKVSREILAFITSGKMSALRELAMAVDYKDWHHLLQRLPQIPHLRSIYIPYIADHVYASHVDAKELALSFIDIVALRPEMELCYLGIAAKCFEILEGDDTLLAFHDSAATPVFTGPDDGDSNQDSDDDHDNEDEDNDDTAGTETVISSEAGGESDSESQNGSLGHSDCESMESDDSKKRPRLRLREILFYDDKVSVFKARHGRL